MKRMHGGGVRGAATSVRTLSNERRAWNARTFSLTLAVIGLSTWLVLSALPNAADISVIRVSLAISALFHLLAYAIMRKGYVSVGAMTMISASLAQHVATATHPDAALVTPFFASIFVMIAAICLRPLWLWPVYLFATGAIAAQYFTGRAMGVPEFALRGPYIAATVLTTVMTVVAWLHTKGIERAIEIAQTREDEREELFLELEKSARMEALGRLAGGIAHDFNNLLVVIQGSAELARDDLPEGAKAADELDQIEGAARRAADLTSQLLAFSRRQVVPTSLIKPSSVLTDLKPLLERLLGSSMSLDLRVDENTESVLASSTQLEQVLMNLAANARDACEGTGRLTVRMTTRQLVDGQVADLPTARYVEISVADNGSGIPDEVMDHLFEPFFTTKEVGRGTGLGLATSFGIVHQMGGLLTAESVMEEGATFRIFIPVAEDRQQASISRLQTSRHPDKALIIDDDETVRLLVRRVLVSAGTDVIEADDTESSLEAARSNPDLDLIITDIVLSEDNGLATLDTLKSLHPGANLIVMSSFSPGKQVMAQLEEKDVRFLAKPFSNAALMAAARGESPPPTPKE